MFDTALSGGPYVRPIEQGHPVRQVGVPVELWRNGWIISLSAIAPALLLVLVEHKGGYSHSRYVVGQRLERYGLSPDTWTLARTDLEQHKLRMVGRTPQSRDSDWRRIGNTYWVDLDALEATFPVTPPK